MDIGLKHTIVGNFYEQVGHQILGGSLSRNDDGDICLWRLATSVEVKASGYKSSYGFRLSLEQIERYGKISRFPFDRAWYMFFAYRNNRGKRGERSTELAQHTTAEAVRAYLASATMWGLIFDLSIVERWRKTRSVSSKSIMGHLGSQTIDVRCSEAYDFANDGLHFGLTQLGVNPIAFSTVTSRIKLSTTIGDVTYRLAFPLRAVLPCAELPRLERLLRRRGYPTTRRN